MESETKEQMDSKGDSPLGTPGQLTPTSQTSRTNSHANDTKMAEAEALLHEKNAVLMLQDAVKVDYDDSTFWGKLRTLWAFMGTFIHFFFFPFLH